MKDNNKVIGVLTPYFGSFYFGTLMIAIHNAALKVGASLVIIRTNDVDPENLLANDHVVGWIVIQKAVSDRYLAQLVAQGKSIVSIGNRIPTEYGQVVVSDNVQSMMQIVEHLIEHGHRQIAFTGYLDQFDMTARFEGYKKALAKHGIPLDLNLVVNTEVHGNESGWDVADRIVTGQLICTAIVACTDITALGIIKHLEAMGFNVPEDYAVTGYDDDYASRSNIPTITSVNQNLELIASRALELLIDQVNGVQRTSDIENIPSNIKLRRSCGCTDNSQLIHNEHELLNPYIDHESRMVNNFELYQFMIKSNKPGLEDLAKLLAPYFEWGTLASRHNTPRDNDLTIDQHYYFKLPERVIEIQTISPEQFPPLPFYSSGKDTGKGTQHITHLIPIRVGNSEHSILAMVSNVDQILSTIPYSLLVQYLDLLAFSLERKASHQELLKQSDKYRLIAEQLEIVSRTTNDGIWDWDWDARLIECNESFLRLTGLSMTPGSSTIRASEFETLIHPDDLDLLNIQLHSHLNDYSPFLFEFRMRSPNGGYIWLSSAGEVLRDSDGQATRMIGSVRDISDRKRYEQQMIFLAFHDPLTGLVNRTRFYSLIKDYVNRPDGLPFALLLLDLDGFKSVNDLYGHQMGDQVLVSVAALLKGLVSLPDHIARFGGDEFVILVPLEAYTDISRTAGSIIGTLKSSLHNDYPAINVTGSLGVSVFPEDSLDPEMLIKYADTAMYMAKQEEKNAFRIFHHSMLSQ